MRCLLALLLTFATAPNTLAQESTGQELLDRAIAYHDPQGTWKTFQGKLSITMTSPKETPRTSILYIDFPKSYFEAKVSKDGHTVQRILDRGQCVLKLNNSPVISDAYRKKFQITCDRAKMLKNYYTPDVLKSERIKAGIFVSV